MNTTALRIVFAGTPEFAAQILASLLPTPYRPIAVFTQPDRPAGRGQQAHISAVKALAVREQLPIHQPERIDASTQDLLRSYQADLVIVVAYGLLLPNDFLNLPRFGCLNLHTSLLPRWRGAAPIQRAIAAGDTETGITLMQMDQGLDTGPVLAERRIAITPATTSQTLHDALAQLGSDLLLTHLPLWPDSPPQPHPQATTGISYAAKIQRQEAEIDWSLSAEIIERRLRAFTPWPGLYTYLSSGERLKIGGLKIVDYPTEHQPAGSMIALTADALVVATGTGSLAVTQAQLPGGRMLAMRDLVNGHSQHLQPGQRFRFVSHSSSNAQLKSSL